jgi:hypothetical protein
VNVKVITPHRFQVAAILAAVIRVTMHINWRNLAARRRSCMLPLPYSSKIIMTVAGMRRRRGQEAGQQVLGGVTHEYQIAA